MSLYKGKYAIAVYDREDRMVSVFDNPDEMAEWLGKTIQSARVMVSKAFHGERRGFTLCGRYVSLHFIDMEEEE